MAGDGILSISATVDKTGVDAGLKSIQDGVAMTVQGVAVQVEETCARTKAAWNKLSEDVKVSAQSVSAQSLKLAEATKAQTAAMADLRRASVLARDSNLGQAETTAILAAAQEKAAVASMAVAEAKQAEAEAVEEANLREGLSENVLVAQFQLASREISTGFAAMKERMVLGAADGSFQIRDLATAFTGVGQAIAAVVAAGMIVHFADDIARVNVELGHLSVETGMNVTALSGLRQIVKESGVDWDAVSVGIVRMAKNLAASGDQMKELKMAVAGVGLSLQDLQGLKPEQQLQKIAMAFANTANEGNVANAAIEIFGRGGKVLIPILKEQGAELEANMRREGQLTGVTDESAAASAAWTRNMAQMTAILQRWGNVALEFGVWVFEKLQEGMTFFASGVLESVEVISGSIRLLEDSFIGLAKVAHDALTGNWGAIQADWQAGNAQLVEDFKNSGQRLLDIGQATAKEIAALRLPAAMSGGADAEGGAGAPGGSGGAGGAPTAPSVWQRLNQQSILRNAEADTQTLQASANAPEPAPVNAAGLGGGQTPAVLAQMQKIPQAILLVQASTQKMTLQIQQQFQKMFQAIIGPFNQFVDHWITSGKNMGLAFARMGDQIAMNFINNEIKMLEKHLQMEIQKRLITQASNAMEVSSTAGASAMKSAIEGKAAMQSLSHSAASAAGKAWDALSGIPVVGPILGAAAAAATYAGIMALGVFDEGGIMGHGKMGVNLSGADERVLSPSQTRVFERVMNQNSTSDNSSREIHFHDHSQWNGIDGDSVRSMYRRHSAEGRREATRQLRLANQI